MASLTRRVEDVLQAGEEDEFVLYYYVEAWFVLFVSRTGGKLLNVE